MVVVIRLFSPITFISMKKNTSAVSVTIWIGYVDAQDRGDATNRIIIGLVVERMACLAQVSTDFAK